MAKTHVLNTDTANFSDLICNGKIYRVPLFQRDYSWDEEQWDDLWEDIMNLQNDSDKFHYMGAIVLQEKSEKEFVIIDGQQRIVTLSIIAIAVIAKIDELKQNGMDADNNEERVSILRGDYLGRKTPGSLFYSSKLFLNKNNDNFYQSNLLQFKKPLNPKVLNDSDGLLWKAYQYFLKKMTALSSLQTGKQFSDFLTESVARQLLFIKIVVEDEVNAYTVFETLNARGLELTATDLLKNYLFSLIKSESDLDVIQKQWTKISDTVGIAKLPEFLRVYINSTGKLIRKDGLFKSIKDRFQQLSLSDRETGVVRLLDDLEKFSYFFQALSDSNDDLWHTDKIEAKNIRRAIKVLSLFKVKQLYPLLFVVYDKFYENSPDKFLKILNDCVVISFRYNIIGSKNPNELEKIYNEAAIKLGENSVKSPKQIFGILQKVYVDDNIFIHDFSYKILKTSSSKRMIRYILFELENNNAKSNHDFDDNPATIEHILPENPNEQWQNDFSDKEQEVYVYRIGNYTLLELAMNRELKNKSYCDKRACYCDSQYALTKSIESPHWDKNSLQLRQEEMAKIAAEIWRINYD